MLDEEKNESATPMVDTGGPAKTHPAPFRSRFISFIKKTIAKTISLFVAICFFIFILCGVGQIAVTGFLYLHDCNIPIDTKECWDGSIKADANGTMVGLILSIPLAWKLGKYLHKKIIKIMGEQNDRTC